MAPRRKEAAPPPQVINYSIPRGAVINFTPLEGPDFKPCTLIVGVDRAGRPEYTGLNELNDEELGRYANANAAIVGWSIARILARRLTGWAPPPAAVPAPEPKAGKAARARAAKRAGR